MTSDGDIVSDSSSAVLHARRIMMINVSLFGFGALSWSEVLEGMLEWIFDVKHASDAIISDSLPYLVVDV